ncbi:hypothetical protein L9F63_025005 [Diploptera punctata]|uniref:Uncharacterized protein n=1 Tax=Diploptera punctata TaxID=6984 RepID=A0AAD7ZCQ3_DIPPU|nr:hypothetical protein L9F63_025005 [Diploptera punctata]
MSLIAKDMELFEQLFALQEAILDYKEQFEECANSSESSPYDSPCSTLSSLNSYKGGSKDTKRSASFGCSNNMCPYPPIAAQSILRRIKAEQPTARMSRLVRLRNSQF